MAPHAQFQGNEDDDHPVFAAKQLDVCGVHLLTFNNVQCFFFCYGNQIQIDRGRESEIYGQHHFANSRWNLNIKLGSQK